MSRGGQNDKSCQLCFAEDAKPDRTIAGIRLGERCYARALNIAADAAADIEQVVYRESVGAIVCVTCGAALEVDEQQLALCCPNGHAVELRTTRPDPAQRPRVCDRCGKPIERMPGQIGRPQLVHDACLTPPERANRTRTREWMRARAKRAKAGGA